MGADVKSIPIIGWRNGNGRGQTQIGGGHWPRGDVPRPKPSEIENILTKKLQANCSWHISEEV
jgi:hypothetical protein